MSKENGFLTKADIEEQFADQLANNGVIVVAHGNDFVGENQDQAMIQVAQLRNVDNGSTKLGQKAGRDWNSDMLLLAFYPIMADVIEDWAVGTEVTLEGHSPCIAFRDSLEPYEKRDGGYQSPSFRKNRKTGQNEYFLAEGNVPIYTNTILDVVPEGAEPNDIRIPYVATTTKEPVYVAKVENQEQPKEKLAQEESTEEIPD